MYQYSPKGVCSQLMIFDVVDGKLRDVKFFGGCDGNLQGIAKLVDGMKVDEVIDQLSGIKCGDKDTSCPDQFSKALMEYKKLG